VAGAAGLLDGALDGIGEPQTSTRTVGGSLAAAIWFGRRLDVVTDGDVDGMHEHRLAEAGDEAALVNCARHSSLETERSSR
jgi:hypothetical protein